MISKANLQGLHIIYIVLKIWHYMCILVFSHRSLKSLHCTLEGDIYSPAALTPDCYNNNIYTVDLSHVNAVPS